MFSKIPVILSALFLTSAVIAIPCKPCNNGPNGKAGSGVTYGPPLILHHPAPDGSELPVQVEIVISDSSARVAVDEESQGCRYPYGFEKRSEIVECPGCSVKAYA